MTQTDVRGSCRRLWSAGGGSLWGIVEVGGCVSFWHRTGLRVPLLEPLHRPLYSSEPFSSSETRLVAAPHVAHENQSLQVHGQPCCYAEVPPAPTCGCRAGITALPPFYQCLELGGGLLVVTQLDQSPADPTSLYPCGSVPWPERTCCSPQAFSV